MLFGTHHAFHGDAVPNCLYSPNGGLCSGLLMLTGGR